MSDHPQLIVFDTTLRDGEQSPGCSMNLAEKLQVAHALRELGVDVIEAGFPIASPGDFEAVTAIAREVHGPVICGLARCNHADVDKAGAAVKHAARPVISVHCHNDLGMAVANSLAAVMEGARQIECTINGIGERAGNAALEELVMAVRTRADFFGLTTQINTRKLYPASRLVQHVT